MNEISDFGGTVKLPIVELAKFEKLFPFYFVTNGKGELVKFGPSLKKILKQRAHRQPFHELFKIRVPANKTVSELINEFSDSQQSLNIEINDLDAELLGQLISIPNQDMYFFVTNLIVQEPEILSRLNLTFSDFAIHDPVFDLLLMIQTQRNIIAKTEKLNEDLLKARDIAEKASQTKSQFLANMSHELRTPMNGLLGMASILQETELDTEQKDYLGTIVESAEIMLSLINDILDLSKIESGSLDFNYSKIETDKFLKELDKNLFSLVSSKGLHLTVDVSQNFPTLIYTDELRLRQILINIIGNSIKFTESGFIKVTIDLDTNKNYRFKVEDSGIGMSKETLERIFKPFVQGDDSMAKKFEGTGLGLSICKKLVTGLGGEIHVKSELNHGSQFEFTIMAMKFDDSNGL